MGCLASEGISRSMGLTLWSLVEGEGICLWVIRFGADIRYDVVLIWH